MASSQPASAAATVFSIPELVDAIVKHVHDMKDLTRCKRVCRTLQNVITSTTSATVKQRLFLAPMLQLRHTKNLFWIPRDQFIDQCREFGILAKEDRFRLDADDSGPKLDDGKNLNPAIPALKTSITADWAWLLLDVKRLFRIVKADKGLLQTFICQPPAAVFLSFGYKDPPKDYCYDIDETDDPDDFDDPDQHDSFANKRREEYRREVLAGLTIGHLVDALLFGDENLMGMPEFDHILVFVKH